MYSFFKPRRRSQLVFDAEKRPSLTRQSEAAACDVNRILSRYQKTGMIDHLNKYQGDYADVADVGSFQESLELVRRSQAAFDSLPSSVRAKFQNDPGKFLDFVGDPANGQAMIDLGLAVPRPPEPSTEAPAPVAPNNPPSGGGA